MYTVGIDVVITRRKRFHIIFDREENAIFRSRLYGEILDWLDREAVEAYFVLDAESGHRRLTSHQRQSERSEAWQN